MQFIGRKIVIKNDASFRSACEATRPLGPCQPRTLPPKNWHVYKPIPSVGPGSTSTWGVCNPGDEQIIHRMVVFDKLIPVPA